MKQIISFFAIACLAGCFGASPEKTGLEGKPLPSFSLLFPDSTTSFNTSRIPKGKSVALFLFSPYCPYCRAQTKEIIENIDKLKEIQFYFVTNFPLHSLNNFYNEYQLSKYSNITAGLDTAHFVSDYFQAPGVPYLAVYGKDKNLNKSFLGTVSSSQLKKVAEQ